MPIAMQLSYNLWLLALSIAIALLVANTVLALVARVFDPSGAVNRPWLLASAIVLGVSFWWMHFVAMLTYSLLIPLTYALRITLASLGIAILTSAAALGAIIRPRSPARCIVAASVLLGAGISGMHYSAITAARLSVRSLWDSDSALNSHWLLPVIGVLAIGILGLTVLAAVFEAHLDYQSRLHARELELSDANRLHQATHDRLTGLPNRKLLLERLQHAILRAQRTVRRLAVLDVRLKDFKLINDTHGHDVGDELLRQVGLRVAKSVRKSDTVARFGGDEFVILACDLTGPTDASELARRLASALEQPYVIGKITLVVTASIGIANYPLEGRAAKSLLLYSDAATYRAKKSKLRTLTKIETIAGAENTRLAASQR